MATVLGRHIARPQKDGPLWSPTHFEGNRGKESAQEICALVLDFDKGHAWEDFLDYWVGRCVMVHTTFQHSPSAPRWRAVLPFAEPCPAREGDEEALWKALWSAMTDDLSGGAVLEDATKKLDPLCDTARMYYLPSCPPEGERFATFLDGDLLDWRAYLPQARAILKERASEAEVRSKGIELRGPGSGRPGDDFNLRATWEEILEPHGWRKVGRRYGAMELWQRPGEPLDDHCARTGRGNAGDRFLCWSTDVSIAPLQPNRVYDKFGLYARLSHGGDIGAATRDIASKGFGGPPLGIPDGPAGEPGKVPTEDPPVRSKKAAAVASPEDQLEMVATEEGELAIDEDPDTALPWTDLGCARRLVREYGPELRYCADWGRWLVWNGAQWKEDAPENPTARGYAHRLADRLYARKRTRELGKKLQKGSNISAMLREAQALPGVNLRYHQLDTHDMLLAVPNGVVDLTSGRLLEPDPALLITKAATVPFDPDAKCPTFERFLVEVMKERQDLVDTLLRALGYSLTGSTKEQKFFLLYGERGRNGKSTLMDVLHELLGDELCFTIRKKLLTDSDADSNRFAKAQLEGRRVVYANETKKGARFDMEFVKDFTGGGRMEAERKGKDGYQFRMRAKLWYAVNSLPGADFDPSFKDRIVPIPFEQSFYAEDSENYQEGDLPPDKDLPAKLTAELPGILALLVKGCLRWQEKGGLGQPEQVLALKRQYEQDNDHVATWIAERCHVGDSARQKTTELFKDFREFAKDAGLRGAIGRINEFAARLAREPGIDLIRPKNVSTFTGIELRRVEQPALGDE